MCILVCLIVPFVSTAYVNSLGCVFNHVIFSLLSINPAMYEQDQSMRLSDFRTTCSWLHPGPIVAWWDLTIRRLITRWVKAKRPFYSRFLISKQQNKYMSVLPLSLSDGIISRAMSQHAVTVSSKYPLHCRCIFHKRTKWNPIYTNQWIILSRLFLFFLAWWLEIYHGNHGQK